MKNKKFRQIVGSKFYKVPFRSEYQKNSRPYAWENTHKLLWSKGVSGIKTGITTSAGPCLATYLNKDGYDLIIVLLCCKSPEARWVETNKLANWSITRLKKIKKF
jgi:D-alanyl-D-alanine carboxypeptidase